MDKNSTVFESFNFLKADAASLKALLQTTDKDLRDALLNAARAAAIKQFGHDIYIRGLIEFTNYCKNDCYYCGIRCSNQRPGVIVLPKNRYYPAVRAAISLVFAHLSCKAVNIRFLPIRHG